MINKNEDLIARLISAYPTVPLLRTAFKTAFSIEAQFLPHKELDISKLSEAIAALCEKLDLDAEILFGDYREAQVANTGNNAKFIQRITKHQDFFDECAISVKSARSVRLTVVGPTFLEPNWWHDRARKDRGDALDFTECLKERIFSSKPLQKCEIILRNNTERYVKNLSQYVYSKTEWKKTLAEMRTAARELFGAGGDTGPRVRCFDPGFNHLPHLFDNSALIGTRRTPLDRVNGGWKISDPSAVALEIEKWTTTFHTYPQDQKEAVSNIRDFLTSLEDKFDE